MKQEEVDQAMSLVSQFGEKTKAMVILEFNEAGPSRISAVGSIPDLAWLSVSLQNFVQNAINAQRTQAKPPAP